MSKRKPPPPVDDFLAKLVAERAAHHAEMMAKYPFWNDPDFVGFCRLLAETAWEQMKREQAKPKSLNEKDPAQLPTPTQLGSLGTDDEHPSSE